MARRWIMILAMAACDPGEPAPGPTGISPQPQPNPGKDVRLDLSKITFEERAGQVVLTGGTKAVGWPGTLWVGNLDAPGGVAMATVDATGAFQLSLAGKSKDRLRAQAESDGSISMAYDLVDEGNRLREIEPSGCLRVQRQVGTLYAFVGGSASEPVEIANECSKAIEIKAMAVRTKKSFSASATLPITVAAGQTHHLPVRFAPASELYEVDLLVLDIDADRYGVTLIGRTTK